MLRCHAFTAEAHSSMTLSEQSGGDLITAIDKHTGQVPSVASIHRAPHSWPWGRWPSPPGRTSLVVGAARCCPG